MVIKGNPRGSPAALAAHLKRTDTNERMEVKEVRGVVATDLTGALQEMDAQGAALRTTRTLYHASMNIRADEHLTDEQWTQAIDRLEEKLGLTGQPRIVVEHEKEGRAHRHIVWARTDLEHMRAIRCDHNYRTHEEVARELELEFGHERVQGAHAEREGPDGNHVMRPDRTPTHAEMQQANRTGLSPQEATEFITALWRATDNGRAFAAALEDHGWILTRGDRRDFVVMDPAGETHSLARRVDGAKAKDVRERMADIDAANLPDVEQARSIQLSREAARNELAAKLEITAPKQAAELPPPGHDQVERPKVAPVLEFIKRLDMEGLSLAIVTGEDVKQLAAERATEFAAADPSIKMPVRFIPEVREGELVAVDRFGGVHRLNEHKNDIAAIESHAREVEGRMSGSIADIRAANLAERERAQEERDRAFLARQENRETISALIDAKQDVRKTVNDVRAAVATIKDTTEQGLRVADKASGAVVKLTAFVDLFGSMFTAPRKISPVEYAISAEAREERHRQYAAERNRTIAIDRMRDSIAAGEDLDASSVRHLSYDDMQNIKAKGDSYVIGLIEEREREREQKRQRDYGGRERER